MIIEEKQCDQCSVRHPLATKTVQIRFVDALKIPQPDREDAETPSWEMALGSSKVVVMGTYDFCDLRCAKAWLEAQPLD